MRKGQWQERDWGSNAGSFQPPEPLGPQPSRVSMQGQLPPFRAFLKTHHQKPLRSASHTPGVPTNTERRSQPRGKGNNKQGCKSKRPISICNSIGKQFHRTLYRHHVNETAPQWSFGNIKGRLREESCSIVRLCMARCRRAKRSCALQLSRRQGRFSQP